jgi:hypothetical protein
MLNAVWEKWIEPLALLSVTGSSQLGAIWQQLSMAKAFREFFLPNGRLQLRSGSYG